MSVRIEAGDVTAEVTVSQPAEQNANKPRQKQPEAKKRVARKLPRGFPRGGARGFCAARGYDAAACSHKILLNCQNIHPSVAQWQEIRSTTYSSPVLSCTIPVLPIAYVGERRHMLPQPRPSAISLPRPPRRQKPGRAPAPHQHPVADPRLLSAPGLLPRPSQVYCECTAVVDGAAGGLLISRIVTHMFAPCCCRQPSPSLPLVPLILAGCAEITLWSSPCTSRCKISSLFVMYLMVYALGVPKVLQVQPEAACW